MTPLELSILIHYRGHASDFRNGDFSAPVVRQTIDYFRGEAQMLDQEDAPNASRIYKLSERGQVFVDALCNVPLPIKRWVMEA